jgi:Na+/melibiose symporter-like transporter
MDGRGVAWLSYVPIPGLALVPVLLNPGDRLSRYHAWQGTALVLGFLAVMFVVGLLTLLSEGKGYRAVVGSVAGILLVAAVIQMAWGAVGAAMGRYPRLRPAWDVAAALRRAD